MTGALLETPRDAARHSLRDTLGDALRGRVAVVGIGNPMRGDDAIGCRIVQRLAECAASLREGVTVIDAEEIPESHLGPIVAARPDVVLLVDAADLGAAPGSVALLDAAALDTRVAATHRTPLTPVARYLEGETGATVRLLAVQPGALQWGESLSGPLEAAARDISWLLAQVLWAPTREAGVP